jgi:hypothetical protein
MADVLKRTVRARVKLTRNDAVLYDQTYYDDDTDYTESTHQRVVLATNMAVPQEVDMAGVSTGAVLFVESDRAINVAVNAIGNVWPLAENGALLLVGSVTHLYLQNESTTNLATVELVVAD